LILDLTWVAFVGSWELRAVDALNRKVREAGGTLRLVNVGPPVARAFSVSRLDTILFIHAGGSTVS
jgi:anti-anti-sigma factor